MTDQQRIRPAPVRKSLHVPIGPAAAFELLLGRMHEWWLAGHSLLKVDVARIVVEPEAGGRWFEEGVDGSVAQWGRVLAWDPPARALLMWQLDAEFTFDPTLETEVEVRFAADGDGTRVDFEHRKLEAYGDKGNAMSAGLGEGWGLLLDSFVKAAGG